MNTKVRSVNMKKHFISILVITLLSVVAVSGYVFSAGPEGGASQNVSDTAISFSDVTIKDTPTPDLNYKDSDCTDDDINGKIYIDATATGTGAEEIDMFFQAMTSGSLFTFMDWDSDAGEVTVSGTLNVTDKVYAVIYGSDGSVTDAELLYINSLSSNAQTQLNGKEGTLTNSAGLIAALNDETGSGLAVFGTAPTVTIPIMSDSVTEPADSGDVVLTLAQCRRGSFTDKSTTGATDFQLDDEDEYMTVRYFCVDGTDAISFVPPSGEAFMLDGTFLDANDEIDITTDEGDKLVFVRRYSTAKTDYVWDCETVRGTATDGGAAD